MFDKSLKDTNPRKADDQPTELNATLVENFSRRLKFRTRQSEDENPPLRMILNENIRKYVKAQNSQSHLYPWQNLPEFPSIEEVFDRGRKVHDQPVELEANVVVGPYFSKDSYLKKHYELLREDAISPLRDVIDEVQAIPYLLERDSRNDSHIYERVYITGFTMANAGVAARVRFSLGRVQKAVNWEQSKRLRTGNLVALTPANAIFKSIAHIAVVAARPLAGLQEDPPSIDLFFTSPESLEIDPQQEWVLVESRNGFYEGHRNVLRGLQMLANETFPLQEHIVHLNRDIGNPRYIEHAPRLDLSSVFPGCGERAKALDVTKKLPSMASTLDSTQLEALQRALSKRLAIIQGPPGTGKTYVSVESLRLMLLNKSPDAPPIIIASHTNHALDQILRHISKFEPNFVRLGAMSTDRETIKPRTIYEIKMASTFSDPQGCMRTPALREMRLITKQLKVILEPLEVGDGLLAPDVLERYDIISSKQRESLILGQKGWLNTELAGQDDGGLENWLGEEKVDSRVRMQPDGFAPLENDDLEMEQLREVEAEGKTLDEGDRETLQGERIDIRETWTGRRVVGITEAVVKEELQKENLYDIPENCRGPVYRSFQAKLKGKLREKVRTKAKRYVELVQEAQIGRWEVEENLLKQAPIIGVTTSGLAKYRGLLQSLKPRIVMIEEAAETLESYVSVAAFESLEHFILVGDHEQLRGRCHVQELELAPFFLGVSMFERLVRNEIDYTQLKCQRRMISEIRRNITPVYPHLSDDKSVHKLHAVPGMDVNTLFFSHRATETSDDQMSKCNEPEAEMIVSFFRYLTQNHVEPEKITILTFYNGQRKLIDKKLRKSQLFPDRRITVVTVDSYQGEENDVVLLSLVRNNVHLNIGFLQSENRAVVALSRAKRGFYVFGNAPFICKSSALWWAVLQIMGSNPRRVGFHLPLKCENHGRITFVNDADELASLDGGCEMPCSHNLPCAHPCRLRCHPPTIECKTSCQCRSAEEADKDVPPVQSKKVTRMTAPNVSQAQLQMLDEENSKALFGAGGQSGVDELRLVGLKDDGAGGFRQRWRGVYLPRKQQEEASLLD